MSKIILATTSPYRIEAFKFLKIDFEAEGSKVDESQAERKDPEKLVKTLSRFKAEAVAKNHSDAIMIGMDSVGCFNGKIFEKPKSRQEAFERLKSLSGGKFEFYTGIYMINTSTRATTSKIVKSELFTRELSEREINQYLEQDPHYNTYALGFDALANISSSFIKKLVGSYNNVLRGMPLEVIPDMLSEVGYKL
jgi:septum formation protein